MTDRINALTVVLENDIRTDDAEKLITAIRQIRGVLNVTADVVNDLDSFVAEQRVKADLQMKLWDVLMK